MNILLVNDDGFGSTFLAQLCMAAASRGHHVTVCAPHTQQSAKSHAFTISRPLYLHERSMEGAAYACSVEGTPVEEIQRRFGQFTEVSARESSQNEIRALMAERDAEDCYMAEFMRQHIGEHFDGVVSGVTQRGVFVRLENSVEGFVSLDSFENESFVYDGLITHRSPKRELTIGTPLSIIVASAYVATGKVDFVPDPEKE